MPDDQKFDDFLSRHAAGYKANQPVPADAIWNRIEGEVADAIGAAPRPTHHASRTTQHAIRARRIWLYTGAGIAAALILGIGIGRWTNQNPRSPRQPVRLAQRDDSVRRTMHLRNTAYDHLAEMEVFLTEVRADMRAGRSDAERAGRSRELLSRTRLLLQRRDAQSADVNRLLEDLELLLAEIAALPPAGQTSPDAKLLEETLNRKNVIPRIRSTVPRMSGI